MPFTPEQFFNLFAAYHQRFLWAAVVLWVAGAYVVAAAWRRPAQRSRALTVYLALSWFWSGVVYHAWLFTTINRAAWIFAGLFILEGIALLAARELRYFTATDWTGRVGVALTIYAFIYPAVSAIAHAYPRTPTFGVPCPTALLTIGVLLTAQPRPRAALLVVPALWGFIGGSAALVLSVWPDYVLLASGVLLTAVTIRRAVTVA